MLRKVARTQDNMNDFKYGDYGIYPQAIVFSRGEYHCFVCFEGKTGVYLAKSNDLLSFGKTTLITEEKIYGQPSAYEKNEILYFFYSTRRGEIKKISIDKNNSIFSNPIPVVKRKRLYDPKVSFMDGKFILLTVNAKNEVLLFSSDNMMDFVFETTLPSPKGSKVRSPSLHKSGDKYILFYTIDGKGLFYCNMTFVEDFALDGAPIFLEEINNCRITLLKDGRTLLSGSVLRKLVFREIWIKDGVVYLCPLLEIRNRRDHRRMINREGILYEEMECSNSSNFSIALSLESVETFTKRVKMTLGDLNVSQTYLLLDRERNFVVLGDSSNPQVTKVERETRDITEIEVYFYDLLMEIAFIQKGFILCADNPFISYSKAKLSVGFSERTNCNLRLYI